MTQRTERGNAGAARNRSFPDVYVVDRTGKVQLSRRPSDELPVGVAATVKRSLKTLREEHVVVSDDGTVVIHLAPLHGKLGSYAIVTLSPFRGRTAMDLAAKQYGLTRREIEVVRLLAQGHGTREIAKALAIADATVIRHIKASMAKTGSRGRLELVLQVVGQQALRSVSS